MTALALTLALVAVVALVAWRRDRVALLERLERLDAEVARLAGARTPPTAASRVEARGASATGPNEVAFETTTTAAPEREFVITHVGEDEPEPDRAPVRVSLTGPAFADAVVRETLVQTASLVHGVRRALAPETRNRIRFEMKRELKRSRKDRKAELKQALREHRARQRRGITVLPDEEGAA
jgi:hypothetical protein